MISPATATGDEIEPLPLTGDLAALVRAPPNLDITTQIVGCLASSQSVEICRRSRGNY
jgi:hypothetical protein